MLQAVPTSTGNQRGADRLLVATRKPERLLLTVRARAKAEKVRAFSRLTANGAASNGVNAEETPGIPSMRIKFLSTGLSFLFRLAVLVACLSTLSAGFEAQAACASVPSGLVA